MPIKSLVSPCHNKMRETTPPQRSDRDALQALPVEVVAPQPQEDAEPVSEMPLASVEQGPGAQRSPERRAKRRG